MKKRKICVVITARPSYSRVKTLLDALQKNPKITLQLVLSGSVLLDKYGSAHKFIEEDGFNIDAKIFNSISGNTLSSAVKTTGIGLVELSTVFENLKPDIVVTIADRFETLGTAISASFMNIPLAHLQGGEVTGNIDEKVRHAITKLSDYHFVSSVDAFRRVSKLGEKEEYIFNTGCPSIDLIKDVHIEKDLDFDIYKKYGGVGQFPDYSKGYIVVLQHPVTNEYEKSLFQINETLLGVKSLDFPTLWFWPNVDSGSNGISNGIRIFRENNKLKNFHFFKNMNSLDFLKLIYHSKGLIGNSSTGIRECAALGIPVVNIGSRQNKRARADNVVDVGYDRVLIKNAIKKMIESDRPKPSNLYGDGNAGEKIAKILEDIPLRYHKTIKY